VTLLEVLLVLAMLVVLAAVAWPALEPALASVELRKSAERIRVEWNRARVEALTKGNTVLFRYEPGSNRYCLEHQAEPEFLPGAAVGDVGGRVDAGDQLPEYLLPERISFVGGEVSDTAVDETGTIASVAGGEWADPVVFYPDGSTSNAKLVLQNERNQCIEITLRGLTGVVSVGDVYSSAEVVP
jgi:type II secretory pathway pseudopilin PulG